MQPPARRRIELEPGTPISDAVTRGGQAFARGDAPGTDMAYQEAAGLAVENPMLWTALTSDHIERLRVLGRVTQALQCCNGYLAQAGTNHLPLWVQRAEIRSCLGDHSGAADDATAIRSVLRSQPELLAPDDVARLHRVEGLAAADRDDLDGAARHRDAARRIFAQAGNQAGVAVIELDKLLLDVRQGDEHAVADVLSGEPPQTVCGYLLLAAALKRELRYEEAFWVLLSGVDHDIDPALHWPVLYELILLLRLICKDGAADNLLPLLRDAAAVSADPAAAEAAAARLSAAGAPSDSISPQLHRRIQYARRLIPRTGKDYEDQAVADRLDEAGSLLEELRSQTYREPDIATWHLAAGELELARDQLSADRSAVQDAVDYLSRAAELASTTALAEVRACALGALGDAFDTLDAEERAVEFWTEAHRLEERIAARQISDDVRVGMLLPVPDEHDKRITAATKMLSESSGEATGETFSGASDGLAVGATAAIIVAMEAARGATILARILPDNADLGRDLPRSRDLFGACRWVNDTRGRLPQSQVAWIMHSTPDRIHHAVLGREFFRHTSVPTRREDLAGSIDELMACWSSNDHLEETIADGQFDSWLAKIAEQVGIGAIISELPQDVHRIAIVAGRELSEIPFAALPVPGGTGPLGLRYALSDLPCLSARLPLHRRSRRLRGDRRLRVRPPVEGITPAAGRPPGPLDGERATLSGLRAALDLHRYRQVRIDTHGQYDHNDSKRSWLQLAPDESHGRLRPEDLQGMDLRGCGTLVLGACESGMARRIGHDERIGFVRAAVYAGAPAVIAARWRAEDTVAATVLDRFERYVRYLPRDLALQRAQADVCRGAPGVPTGVPAVDHPARWACWTLYGDSGRQTRAGSVRRFLRRSLDQRRRYVAHS